jgi:hypothetical protein
MNTSNYHYEFKKNEKIILNYEKAISFGLSIEDNNVELHPKIEEETLREYKSNFYDLIFANLKDLDNVDVILYNLLRILKNNGHIYLSNANKIENIKNFNLSLICMEENFLIAKKIEKNKKIKLLDVVIVSFAKDDLLKKTTQKCIESLLCSETNSEDIFNVIVVESNPNVTWDHISPCVKTYKTSLPYGYHKFLNFGRKQGNAEWVALCNNDIEFTFEWFTKILESSTRQKDALSFSPICSFTQVKNGIKKNSGDLIGYQIRNHISGWCIVQRRKIYEIIKDLDEDFIHWCCDSDYALTLFKHELKHVLVTDSVVNHHGEKIGITTIIAPESMENISNMTVGSKIPFDKKYYFEAAKLTTLKDEIINNLIEKNNYKRYLEIGIRTGCNFKKINCEVKIGVDPFPKSDDTTHEMTSDMFFSSIPEDEKYDIILIDGLHTDDQVDKDIENSLLHLNENGSIILHDCNPPSEFHAKETPFYDPPICAEWNGTVYKSLIKIRMTRTDVHLVTIDSDYGVGIITKRKNKIPVLNTMHPINSWEFFTENKKEILNLISYEEFKLLS